MLLKNNAEGGTNGTTVTTGNSGGASGDPWDAVFLSNGAGTVVYDTAQSAHGGLAIRQSTGATADSIQLQWAASLGAPTRVYGRVYYRFSSLSLTLDVLRVRSNLANQIARIGVTTAGLVQLRNGANTVVATSTAVLAVNTWYRFEFDWRPGGSVTNTVLVYAGDAAAPLDTLSATSSYSTDASCGEFHLGNLSSQANVGARWFDDIAITDVGPVGPVPPQPYAIERVTLTSGSAASGASSANTASVFPAANALLVVSVVAGYSSAPPSITASGLSLTWTLRDQITFNSQRLCLFTAQCGASPGSGALSLNFGGSANNGGAVWDVEQVTGHDVSGPVAQTATSSNTSSAVSVTLPNAARASASRILAAFGDGGVAVTPGANLTEIVDLQSGVSLETMWRSDAFQATASGTMSSSQPWGAVAVELVANPAVKTLGALGVG